MPCVALVTEVKWLSELNELGERNALEAAALILSWIFQGIYPGQRPRARVVTISLALSPSGRRMEPGVVGFGVKSDGCGAGSRNSARRAGER